jgi:hypothetical protein
MAMPSGTASTMASTVPTATRKRLAPTCPTSDPSATAATNARHTAATPGNTRGSTSNSVTARCQMTTRAKSGTEKVNAARRRRCACMPQSLEDGRKPVQRGAEGDHAGEATARDGEEGRPGELSSPAPPPDFAFHRPQTLLAWANEKPSLRGRLAALPPLDPSGLRQCQIEAITGTDRLPGLEASLARATRASSSKWRPVPARPSSPAPSSIA